MIAHSIERARESGLFASILVSTDSEKIANVAKEHGADVPFLRDANISDDHTCLYSVIVDALERCAHAGQSFQYACCILATAPMLEAADLKNGYTKLREFDARMSLPVATFPYCIFRALRSDDTGRATMIWPENLLRRSQDFPETFHDAGMFYWIDVAKFLRNPSEFFADAVPLPSPRNRVQDIDTPEDWDVAERLFMQHTPNTQS